MVDAAAAGSARVAPHAMTGETALLDRGIAASVSGADSDALVDYRRYCEQCVFAPPQSPTWTEAWIAATDADVFLATLWRGEQRALTIPLEVVPEGPFRIARFPGGSHANGNLAAAPRSARRNVDAAELRAVMEAVRAARPDVDALALQRQNPGQDGYDNPLAATASRTSPNISLAVDLEGGFDKLMERASGKRKRKKYRFQLRKFEEQGGFRLIEARTEEEVDRLLGEFFEMKAQRFRKKGIQNVFGPPEVQDFFRRLYGNALTEEGQPFSLHGLEVGGELRAVNGLSITGRKIVCEFGGIRDEDSTTSPGYFLDYTNIEQACAAGMDIYDFSVGDEDYKRSWCEIETWQFDTMLPLTAKGRAYVGFDRLRSRAVHALKNNAGLWSAFKDLRSRFGARE